MKNIIRRAYVLFVGTVIFINLPSTVRAYTLQDKVDNCFVCHQENEMLPEGFSENDIHFTSGIGCVGCHGGSAIEEDEEIAMSSKFGFIGVPDKKDIPATCGKCHSDIEFMRQYRPRIATDQVSQYFESVHGKKLKQGDNKVADCTSCHSAHSILPVDDPRSSVYPLNLPETCNHCHGNSDLMYTYKLKSNQYEEYSKSVHGVALLEHRDISAPACNDCHGNHGATPPGIQSISHVCGTCHVNNQQYFEKSNLSTIFSEAGFHGCEECHGYHSIPKPSDDMLGVGEKSVCIKCHDSGDVGYDAALSWGGKLNELRTIHEHAAEVLAEVVKKGMNDVDIDFALKDVNQSLIQLRTFVHTFDSKLIVEKADEGIVLANNALELADKEIEEYYNRRIGFGFATLAFVILAFGVYLKIRKSSNVKHES
ncbi:MAG: cytochrome c3 family protein [Bacteroidetes bacterium]|nr:cytochrome c3 family protein [Bacteroidota bacterium]